MKKKYSYFIGSVLGIYAIALAMNGIRQKGLANISISLLMASAIGCLAYWFFYMSSKKHALIKRKKDILKQTSLTEESLADIENGIIPVVNTSKLMLRASETCHYFSTATRLITKNKVVSYQGGSSGVSFRITKGISWNTGSYKGVPIRADVSEKSFGEVFVTNKRIIFLSQKDNFEVSLDNIVAMEIFSDGVGVQDNKGYYLMKLIDPTVSYAIIETVAESNRAS